MYDFAQHVESVMILFKEYSHLHFYSVSPVIYNFTE